MAAVRAGTIKPSADEDRFPNQDLGRKGILLVGWLRRSGAFCRSRTAQSQSLHKSSLFPCAFRYFILPLPTFKSS